MAVRFASADVHSETLTIGEIRRHDSNLIPPHALALLLRQRQRAEHVGLVGAWVSVQPVDDDHGSLDFALDEPLAVGAVRVVVDEGEVGGLLLVAVEDAGDFEEGDFGAGDGGEVGVDGVAGVLLGEHEG